MSRVIMTEETCDEINRNQLNDSTAKNLWTFPREKRFKSEMKLCPHISYNFDLSTNKRRYTNFGYGRRLDFKLKSVYTPSPAVYTLKGAIQNQTGKSFGQARQKVAASSYISAERVRVPGPAEYQPTRPGSSINQGYTMRPKTAHDRNYFIDDKERMEVPGPGCYLTNEERTPGKAVLSKFKSVKGPNLALYNSKRFRTESDNPGPGNYFVGMTKTNLNTSQHSSTNGTMSKQMRISFTDGMARMSVAPGPGNYKLPSDFGHYLRRF